MKAVLLDAASLGQGISFEPMAQQLELLTVFEHTAADQVLERIVKYECVICNKVVLNSDILQKCSQLKLICVTATGLNNVDLEAADKLGIKVLNVKDYAGPIVSQHAMGLILMLAHNFPYYTKAAADGTWCRSKEFCLFGPDIYELEGKTLGIIGYGAIGRKLAEKASVFGMNILLAKQPNRTYSVKAPYTRTSLARLLPQADVLSIHCPLTPDTKNLIGIDELKQMKSSAFLINTARGGIVEEKALVSALRNKLISGAALDVLSQEPPAFNHPLLAKGVPNLILTPHNSWAGRKTRQLIINKTADNIRVFRQSVS